MSKIPIHQKLDKAIGEYVKMFDEKPHIFGVDELLLYERITNAINTKTPLKDIRENLADEFDGKSEDFII